MKAAVIGIGSNSLRLLVADITEGNQTAILRERIGLRVFASLNARREISGEMIQNACQAVALMKCSAENHGAETVRLFATSAVRDAANQAALTDALFQATGLTLDICSGEEEARLSFLGAAGDGSAGMIDIGGGSTEIVVGDGGEILYSCSLQAGAVRLFRALPVASTADLPKVFQAVRSLLFPHLQHLRQAKTPAAWVGVGGTMTAAASCIQNIPWDSAAGIHGYTADMSQVKHILEDLADMTPEQRKRLRSVPPDRADIFVHGLAILYACMDTLAIQRITVSEHTNLDGYLKRVTAGG